MDSEPAHGIFVWNELNSRNVEAAKSFYAAALGWTFEAMPVEGGDPYWTIKNGDVRVGGIILRICWLSCGMRRCISIVCSNTILPSFTWARVGIARSIAEAINKRFINK